MVMSDRKVQTNKVEQVDLKPFASKLKNMKFFILFSVEGII